MVAPATISDGKNIPAYILDIHHIAEKIKRYVPTTLVLSHMLKAKANDKAAGFAGKEESVGA